MKFKMNNMEWKIEIISNDKMNTLCGSDLRETLTNHPYLNRLNTYSFVLTIYNISCIIQLEVR